MNARLPSIAIALTVLAASGCVLGRGGDLPAGRVGDPLSVPLGQGDLPDGIYEILREGDRWEQVGPEGEEEQVAVFLPAFRPGASSDLPGFFLLRRGPDVPLRLDTVPVPVKSDRGPHALRSRLVPECALLFEALTRRCVGGRVAILIGGEVVCVPEVRRPVRGGWFEVHCADEEALRAAGSRLAALVEPASLRSD